MKAGDIKVNSSRHDHNVQSDHESLNTMTTGDSTDDDFDDDTSCDEGTLTSITRQPKSEYLLEYTEEPNYEVINEGTTVYYPVSQTNGMVTNASQLFIQPNQKPCSKPFWSYLGSNKLTQPGLQLTEKAFESQ